MFRRAALAAVMSIYCLGAVETPAASGLPALIHSMVSVIGRSPTTTKTPSRTGTNGVVAPAGTGVKPYPETRLSPTAKPALVSESASTWAALAHSNQGWFGWSRVQALPVGYETLTPSGNWPVVRLESICALVQPNSRNTTTISLARLRASASSAGTTINSVSANASIPANHSRALGGSLMPILPTRRGSITFCNAKLSAVSRADSLFNLAIFSAEDCVTLPSCFCAASATSYKTYADAKEATSASTPNPAQQTSRPRQFYPRTLMSIPTTFCGD